MNEETIRAVFTAFGEKITEAIKLAFALYAVPEKDLAKALTEDELDELDSMQEGLALYCGRLEPSDPVRTAGPVPWNDLKVKERLAGLSPRQKDGYCVSGLTARLRAEG